MDFGHSLGCRDVKKYVLAASIGAYVMSIVQFLQPTVFDSSGLWGGVKMLLNDLLGKNAPIVTWIALGTVFLLFAVFKKCEE